MNKNNGLLVGAAGFEPVKRGLILLISLTIIFVTVCLPYGVARAEYKFAENWTWQDTAWQGAFVAVLAADWTQTRYIAKNPDKYHETNPILGKHPSTSQVDTYMAGCVLGHTLISLALPPKAEIFGYTINPRRIWQGVWIGIEAGYVIHNTSIGVKFEF